MLNHFRTNPMKRFSGANPRLYCSSMTRQGPKGSGLGSGTPGLRIQKSGAFIKMIFSSEISGLILGKGGGVFLEKLTIAILTYFLVPLKSILFL